MDVIYVGSDASFDRPILLEQCELMTWHRLGYITGLDAPPRNATNNRQRGSQIIAQSNIIYLHLFLSCIILHRRAGSSFVPMARPYELVVFGATGYTGRYTAEYITEHAATDLKWAIAGRSQSKLDVIAKEIKSLNPNRTSPSIEVAELEKQALLKLAQKTKVLVSTVGPYHKFVALPLLTTRQTLTFRILQIWHSCR